MLYQFIENCCGSIILAGSSHPVIYKGTLLDPSVGRSREPTSWQKAVAGRRYYAGYIRFNWRSELRAEYTTPLSQIINTDAGN